MNIYSLNYCIKMNFRFSAIKKSWPDAKIICQANGGKLFEPKNKAENDAVHKKARETNGLSRGSGYGGPSSFDTFWMGIVQIGPEGQWVYDSDQSVVIFLQDFFHSVFQYIVQLPK